MIPRRVSQKLLIVLWLAYALRVWRLGTQSLWYDEAYSAYLGARLPLDQALELTVRDIVPPLYYLLLRTWLPNAGTSEFALRFLSVLFGVVAVALMAQIGRLLVRLALSPANETQLEQASFLSAALTAIAPVFIWLSRDARMYGPLMTWTLLAVWGLLWVMSPTAPPRSRRRGWALFVGAGLAALYTHTVSAFWLLGQVLAGLLITWHYRHQRGRVREALAAMGALVVGYVPWAIVAAVSYQANAGYWPGYLPPSHLWRISWETFVGGQHLSSAWTSPSAIGFAIAALSSGLILLLKRPRVAAYLFAYLAIPLLAMGIAFQRTPKLAPRYPTAMAPALFLIVAVAAVIAFRGARISRYSALIVLVGVALVSLRADYNLLLDRNYGNADWRAASDYIRAHRTPDEPVLLISGHAFPVLAYYYGWDGWEALPNDVQLDVKNVLDYPAAAPELNEILSAASGVWLVLWQDEVVDPTGLAPALLSDVGRELPTPTFQGSSAGDQVELRHYVFQTIPRFPDELPVHHTLAQTVAPGLTALGYSLPSEPIPADVEIPLRVFWLAEKTLDGTYAASFRLYDSLDQEWARHDTLLAGPYFSERWPSGSPVMGQYTMTLPIGTPPGTFSATLTVYRSDETFETLRLTQLEITRPISAPLPSDLGALLNAPAMAVEDESSQLSLIGVGFDQQTVTPCQSWSLSLAWQVNAQPIQDYGLRLNIGSDQVETPLALDFRTSRWLSGDIWRTRHRLFVSCRALDGVTPVVAFLLDENGHLIGAPIDLGEITIVAGRVFEPPTELTAVLNAELPALGTLLGYRLDEDRAKPGENLQVTLYWRADQETEHNYSVFTHLQSDRVWAQHDSWPADGQKPTSTWARGEVIADRHVIPIGDNVPPGSYQLIVGIYDSTSLEPVAAYRSDGRPFEQGRVILQSIMVDVP